jgi:hypothetical protein
MPFGLSNAPVVFPSFLNLFFCDLLDKSVVEYLNHILVFSESKKEHAQHVFDVLTRLRKKFVVCES